MFLESLETTKLALGRNEVPLPAPSHVYGHRLSLYQGVLVLKGHMTLCHASVCSLDVRLLPVAVPLGVALIFRVRSHVLATCLTGAACCVTPTASPAIRGRGAGKLGLTNLSQCRCYGLHLFRGCYPQTSLSVVIHMKTIIAWLPHFLIKLPYLLTTL